MSESWEQVFGCECGRGKTRLLTPTLNPDLKPRPGLLHSQRRYRKQDILFVLSETVSVSILRSAGYVQSELMVLHRGLLRASV